MEVENHLFVVENDLPWGHFHVSEWECTYKKWRTFSSGTAAGSDSSFSQPGAKVQGRDGLMPKSKTRDGLSRSLPCVSKNGLPEAKGTLQCLVFWPSRCTFQMVSLLEMFLDPLRLLAKRL